MWYTKDRCPVREPFDTDEEYKEYFYSKHYLRYDKIVEKWFSKCKKEVTD